MNNIKTDIPYKAISIAAGMATGVISTAIAKMIWKTIKKEEPPLNPENPEINWKDALLWTIATGVTAGVTRLLIMRGANKGWQAATGQLPGQVV